MYKFFKNSGLRRCDPAPKCIKRPGAIILKVGTMDDPTQYGGPELAIFTCDKQAYHEIPDGIPTFERRP